MIHKELIKTKKIALVEVILDFDDSYMKLIWPLGTQLEVNLEKYENKGAIARYTAGHGIHLTLFADHVKIIKSFIEKKLLSKLNT